MLEFDSVEEYARAFAKGKAPAILTGAMAAEVFNLAAATINNRVKRGMLEGVRISGTNYVSLSSLNEVLAEDDNAMRIVRAYLEQQARQGNMPVNYAPAMELIGLDHKLSADRMRFGYLLGRISRQTYDAHGLLLSVMVQKKGTTMPSDQGFFGLVDDLGLEYKNTPEGKQAFVAAEMKKLQKHLRKR